MCNLTLVKDCDHQKKVDILLRKSHEFVQSHNVSQHNRVLKKCWSQYLKQKPAVVILFTCTNGTSWWSMGWSVNPASHNPAASPRKMFIILTPPLQWKRTGRAAESSCCVQSKGKGWAEGDICAVLFFCLCQSASLSSNCRKAVTFLYKWNHPGAPSLPLEFHQTSRCLQTYGLNNLLKQGAVSYWEAEA